MTAAMFDRLGLCRDRLLQMGDIMNFRLSTPRRETFLVSVVIAALVVLGMIVPRQPLAGAQSGLFALAFAEEPGERAMKLAPADRLRYIGIHAGREVGAAVALLG